MCVVRDACVRVRVSQCVRVCVSAWCRVRPSVVYTQATVVSRCVCVCEPQ